MDSNASTNDESQRVGQRQDQDVDGGIPDTTGHHTLTLIDVNQYGPNWKLECHHDKGSQTIDTRWQCRNEDGTVDDDSECWLQTWWEELGAELLDLKNLEITIAVKPDDTWSYDESGCIVNE